MLCGCSPPFQSVSEQKGFFSVGFQVAQFNVFQVWVLWGRKTAVWLALGWGGVRMCLGDAACRDVSRPWVNKPLCVLLCLGVALQPLGRVPGREWCAVGLGRWPLAPRGGLGQPMWDLWGEDGAGPRVEKGCGWEWAGAVPGGDGEGGAAPVGPRGWSWGGGWLRENWKKSAESYLRFLCVT